MYWVVSWHDFTSLQRLCEFLTCSLIELFIVDWSGHLLDAEGIADAVVITVASVVLIVIWFENAVNQSSPFLFIRSNWIPVWGWILTGGYKYSPVGSSWFIFYLPEVNHTGFLSKALKLSVFLLESLKNGLPNSSWIKGQLLGTNAPHTERDCSRWRTSSLLVLSHIISSAAWSLLPFLILDPAEEIKHVWW